VKLYGKNDMQISFDANIWILGILDINPFCVKILINLSKFNVALPNQIRAEVERNLANKHVKQFYQFVLLSGARIDFETVPPSYIKSFEEKGLKKGDAEIGAFCEWRKVDIIVSNNRDFLRGLSPGHYFEVMSPQEFCERFGL